MKTPGEYTSFPEASSPAPEVVGDVEKECGFFEKFSTHLADSSSNSIDLLKLLSDGIADLLFNGSNRLETDTEVTPNSPLILHGFSYFLSQDDQSGLYLLRADQDLLEKFLPSNARRSSISENEVEYFIAHEEMITRVLNDYKTARKIDSNPPSSLVRQQSSSASTPSPSAHRRFFFQTVFNETTKPNTYVDSSSSLSH